MASIVSGSTEQKGTRSNGFNYLSSSDFRNYDNNRTGFRGRGTVEGIWKL